MNRSLAHRMDDRTRVIFEDDLLIYHRAEAGWIKVLALDLKVRGHTVSVEDHGVDNTGAVIEGYLENNNTDFKLLIDSRVFHIDVKTVPEWSDCYTFKVKLLEEYIKQKGYILVPRRKFYYMFAYPVMQDMLKKYPHKIYDRFSSNDEAIRFWQDDMGEYVAKGWIKKCEWTPEAKVIIEKNLETLFPKRKRK